jgi:hypothetical protein
MTMIAKRTATPSAFSLKALVSARHYAFPVRAYALVELGDSEAIDLFLREEDARAALEDAVRDEPAWASTLSVEEIELDGRDVSAN